MQGVGVGQYLLGMRINLQVPMKGNGISLHLVRVLISPVPGRMGQIIRAVIVSRIIHQHITVIIETVNPRALRRLGIAKRREDDCSRIGPAQKCASSRGSGL